ncbi:MAG: SEC59/DGK1/VTE5 family protein [Chloroherpetonaceae bacterium]|nr:SEC59/DGK1/VTE5 family protein [Chloroherpetonaceae bacterium]MDW8019459.1 SEC59/DGK1/VTE5 family protein [Chloroherpetonaceae bacterium]MDW8464693.1 SEC59/DGK1/VTE5 family protein [Chloroherpetonaceae bacterium]
MQHSEPEGIGTLKEVTQNGRLDAAQIEYHNELARKAIHVCSIAIPLIYYHITQKLAIVLLTILFLGFFTVDFVKMFVQPVAVWYFKTFGSLLRPHEKDPTKKRFNGATFVTLSALLTVALFPKIIAIASFAILIVADTAAALVGRKFGKHKLFSKTVEGSLAFLIAAIAVVALTPHLNFAVGIGLAVVATIAEVVPFKIGGYTIDDNLTIPLSAAAFAYVCYWIFLPNEIPLLMKGQ